MRAMRNNIPDMKNTFPNNSDQEWQKDFNELFVDERIHTKTAPDGWWQTDYDYDYTATPARVKDFIEKTLSSQAHVLKEQLKTCVPERTNMDITWSENPLSHTNNTFDTGHNTCREQTLNNLDKI